MNKILLLLTVLIVSGNLLQAQTFPNFGIISQEERELKECAFDREADAVYLLHEAVSNYNDHYNLLTEHHVRLKILKEKGIQHADILIPYYSDDGFEYISEIEAQVFNYDDQGNSSIHKLDKKSVYNKKTTKYHSETRFALPSVKVGSIIEYRYLSTMKHYGGLKDWSFQEELPVIKSKYTLTILPNYEFSYLFHKSPSMPADVKSDPQAGRIFFTMNNISGLKDEPYMDARKDYLQRVAFQLSAHKNTSSDGYSTTSSTKTEYSASWQQVIQEINSSDGFGNQLNKNLEGTESFIRQVKLVNDNARKAEQVYYYVRNSMSRGPINSKFSPDGIKNAWNKKTGTNGEINLVLINLLRAAGLEANPLLVSERKNGSVNKDYPSADQFNAVYAIVPAGNKTFYLDASNKFAPPGIIPVDILNTVALVVNKKTGGLITVADEAVQYREVINIMATADAEGNLKGDVFLSSQHYARVERLKEYRQDKENFLNHYFRHYISGIQIDSFSMQDELVDSVALKQQFSFRSAAQHTGDYLFVPVNLFTGYDKNPFVAASRFTNINFGYRQVVKLNLIIQLPTALAIDAMPKPMKLVNEDNTILFERNILYDEAANKIVARIHIELKKSLFALDEYETLKEFYKKMFSLLNEQIVVKKKS